MKFHPATILQQIHSLAANGKVSFTYKALGEMASLELDLDETDVCSILLEITTADFFERKKSKITQEWLYIFKVNVQSILIYLKLILRDQCLIVSFHEDQPYEKTKP